MRLINNIVEKQFKSDEAAFKEAAILKYLSSKGLKVPQVISHQGDTIQMEYIKGYTLPDLIDMWEQDAPSDVDVDVVAKGLVEWLVSFYIATDSTNTKAIRGDINGRNFIFDGKDIWGLDFEEECFGDSRDDIGLLLAFITTYNPANTSLKKLFAKQVVSFSNKMLNIALEDIEDYHQKGIRVLMDRRGAAK